MEGVAQPPVFAQPPRDHSELTVVVRGLAIGGAERDAK
jgi:hypothetical protein